jgi:translation elongation factor EF-1alpha
LEVISARRGEFETGFEKGGQTREHAMLVKTAGVKHLCCMDKMSVVTKKSNVLLEELD